MAGHRLERSDTRRRGQFHPEQCLPKSWQIPSSGQHFYKFGFSLFSNGFSDRKAIYHPLLVFAIPATLIVRFGWSTATPAHIMSRQFHLMIGDFGYFMGFKSHMNAAVFLVFLVSVLSHTMHCIHCLMGKPEHCLCVFHMMCGRITPASIGLRNRTTIKTILRKSRLAFKLLDFTRFSITLLIFFCSFFAFVFTVSWLELIFIGELKILKTVPEETIP